MVLDKLKRIVLFSRLYVDSYENDSANFLASAGDQKVEIVSKAPKRCPRTTISR